MSNQSDDIDSLLESLHVDTRVRVDRTRRLARRNPLADAESGDFADTEFAETLEVEGDSGHETLQKTVADETSSVKLAEEVGSGGLSCIYRAVQAPFERDIAVKALREDKVGEQAARTLVQEGILTGWLDHPNIVPVYDLIEEDGTRPGIMMKHIVGRPWNELIDEPSLIGDYVRGTDPLSSHVEILLEVCKAISFAHQRGILHCDLKPHNVMVGGVGEVYVIDWGLAFIADGSELPGNWGFEAREETVPVGTPGFMAPEMVTGDPARLSPAIDIYLLGATLHAAVTGRPPHSGETLEELLRTAHRSEPHTYEANIPPELVEVIHTAMARDPNDRYESVDAMREALVDYRRHEQSRKLTDEGIQKTLQLRETMEERGGEVDEARFYQQIGRAHFALEEALELWEDNARARGAFQTLLEEVIEWELAREDLRIAPMFIEELPRPHPEFQERLDRIQDLQEAHRKRHAYMQSAPEAMAVVGADGTIDYVNDKLVDMFGWSSEELVGEPIERLMPERFRGRHVAHRDAYAEAPSRRPMGSALNLSAVDSDGQEFAVDISLSPVETDGDEFVIASIQRLGKQDDSDDDKTSTLPRAILKAWPNPVLVERQGRIIFANAAAIELFDLERVNQVVGHRLEEFLGPIDRVRDAAAALGEGDAEVEALSLTPKRSSEAASATAPSVSATLRPMHYGAKALSALLVELTPKA